MKKPLLLTALFVAVFAFLLTSCKKDDSSVENKLVVVKRSNGKLFTVDKTNGSLTEIGHITLDGDSLRGLRCLVYDPATEKAYAGSTNDDNGKLYSIDLKTGVATMLNDNSDVSRDAISGLLISGDSLIANMYSRVVGNSALTRYSKTSGEDGKHRILTNGTYEGWSTGGIIYGDDETKLIIGGEDEIYLSNVNGIINDTIPLVNTTNINDPGGVYVMAMAKESDVIYAILYESDELNHYLVKLNTSTGAITEITLLVNGNNKVSYHCLAVIPENVLP